MKILVFIEHDIIIRHFVHSRVFDRLTAAHDVTFVFPEPGYKRVTMDVSKLELGAPFRHLTVHQERLVTWRRLFQVDLLRWRKGDHFAALRHLHKIMMGKKASALYTLLALPGIYQIFRLRSLARIGKLPNTDLENLISEEKPDLLIHPSVLEGVYINELVAISRERGIPLAVIMNSWDNPSTKRAMVGIPDWLLVWGEQTRQHAIEFVGSPPERTIAFGAAQFDVYKDAPRISREEFCRRHRIELSSRVLLYAGSSKETDEYNHLETIEKAIDRGEIGDVTVVYRPHPWGNGGKGGGRILDRAWKHIRIEESMRGYLEKVRAGNLSMSFPDYRDTHDVLSNVDALVSPLSTIVLEGALHSKPALCFLPVEETDARHFQLVMPLMHFEDMFNSPEFLTVTGLDELVPGIVRLLERVNDSEYRKRLARVCEYFVTPFERPYGERLVGFCEHAAGKAPASERVRDAVG